MKKNNHNNIGGIIMVDIKDFKREQKKREIKEGFKRGIAKTGMWISDNKEVLMFTVPIAAGAIVKTTKVIRNKQEMDARNRREWDPRTGQWWTLKRALNSYQKLELEERYNNGESKGAILSSMGLLK